MFIFKKTFCGNSLSYATFYFSFLVDIWMHHILLGEMEERFGATYWFYLPTTALLLLPFSNEIQIVNHFYLVGNLQIKN